jgi:hypothetical protein
VLAPWQGPVRSIVQVRAPVHARSARAGGFGTVARPCRLRCEFISAPTSCRLRPHSRATPLWKAATPVWVALLASRPWRHLARRGIAENAAVFAGSRRCRHDRSHLGKRRLQCGAEITVSRAAHPPLARGFVVSAGHHGSLRERVARHSITESGDDNSRPQRENHLEFVRRATRRLPPRSSDPGPPDGTPWPPFPPPRPSPLDTPPRAPPFFKESPKGRGALAPRAI